MESIQRPPSSGDATRQPQLAVGGEVGAASMPGPESRPASMAASTGLLASGSVASGCSVIPPSSIPASRALPASICGSQPPRKHSHPGAHSDSSVHDVRHSARPHANGAQSRAEPRGQMGEAPSHDAVDVSTPSRHVEVRQTVSRGATRASHRAVDPVSPTHSSAASQSPLGLGPHDDPPGRARSGGQSAFAPSHDSRMSHSPTASRQIRPAVATASTGQAALVPVHASATSQAPAEGRQTAPASEKASGGQAALEPEQDSGRSQSPAAGRHTAPGADRTSVGQLGLVPVHVSAMSQSPAAGRHTTPAPWTASAGQRALAPVQASARSQSATAPRHVVPAGA